MQIQQQSSRRYCCIFFLQVVAMTCSINCLALTTTTRSSPKARRTIQTVVVLPVNRCDNSCCSNNKNRMFATGNRRRFLSPITLYVSENDDSLSIEDREDDSTASSSKFSVVDNDGFITSRIRNDDDDNEATAKPLFETSSVPISQKPRNATEKESLWEASVPLSQKPKSSSKNDGDDIQQQIKQQQRRNIGVAIASVLLAISNYFWQYTHPVTPIQILAQMERESTPVTLIGKNGKPSVVDFWAPWCENCKLAAPTYQKVEEKYRDKVNFVMINGDKDEAWPYISRFGVDAIPHLALVSADGDVETALIGPIPKSVLEADLNVLIDNAAVAGGAGGSAAKEEQQNQKQPLPYVMLDVFANKPELRRVSFDEKM